MKWRVVANNVTIETSLLFDSVVRAGGARSRKSDDIPLARRSNPVGKYFFKDGRNVFVTSGALALLIFLLLPRIFPGIQTFSSVVGAWRKEYPEIDYERVNANGGAIAIGHPLGATGARLMTNLVHEMKRRNLKYGLQAICEGGGTANGTIVELV